MDDAFSTETYLFTYLTYFSAETYFDGISRKEFQFESEANPYRPNAVEEDGRQDDVDQVDEEVHPALAVSCGGEVYLNARVCMCECGCVRALVCVCADIKTDR